MKYRGNSDNDVDESDDDGELKGRNSDGPACGDCSYWDGDDDDDSGGDGDEERDKFDRFDGFDVCLLDAGVRRQRRVASGCSGVSAASEASLPLAL
jgi:hypothetical protein